MVKERNIKQNCDIKMWCRTLNFFLLWNVNLILPLPFIIIIIITTIFAVYSSVQTYFHIIVWSFYGAVPLYRPLLASPRLCSCSCISLQISPVFPLTAQDHDYIRSEEWFLPQALKRVFPRHLGSPESEWSMCQCLFGRKMEGSKPKWSRWFEPLLETRPNQSWKEDTLWFRLKISSFIFNANEFSFCDVHCTP